MKTAYRLTLLTGFALARCAAAYAQTDNDVHQQTGGPGPAAFTYHDHADPGSASGQASAASQSIAGGGRGGQATATSSLGNITLPPITINTAPASGGTGSTGTAGTGTGSNGTGSDGTSAATQAANRAARRTAAAQAAADAARASGGAHVADYRDLGPQSYGAASAIAPSFSSYNPCAGRSDSGAAQGAGFFGFSIGHQDFDEVCRRNQARDAITRAILCRDSGGWFSRGAVRDSQMDIGQPCPQDLEEYRSRLKTAGRENEDIVDATGTVWPAKASQVGGVPIAAQQVSATARPRAIPVWCATLPPDRRALQASCS